MNSFECLHYLIFITAIILIIFHRTFIYREFNFKQGSFSEDLPHDPSSCLLRAIPPHYLQYPHQMNLKCLLTAVKQGRTLSLPVLNRDLEYTLHNTHCNNGKLKRLNFLILVKSMPSHIAARNFIRSTWGNESCWGKWTVKRMFLVGHDHHRPHYNQEVEDEARIFKDIIRRNIIENYYNTTYKIIMGYQWASEFCSEAPLIYFVDDDFFVYPRNLMRYVNENVNQVGDFIGGYLQRKALVERQGKCTMTYEEIPWVYWPPFVSGGSVLVSRNIARDIAIAARFTKYLRLDDVFIFLIVYKLGYHPTNIRGVHLSKTQMETQLFDVIAVHQGKESNGFRSDSKLWKLLNAASICTSV